MSVIKTIITEKVVRVTQTGMGGPPVRVLRTGADPTTRVVRTAVAGPQGPPGEDGAPGSQGPAGPTQDLSGYVVRANDLSDLHDIPTARNNLGLGTLATQDGTFSGTHSGNSSGNNTGDQTNITGNAGTATALQTARTIGGVSFDGSANITVQTATGGFTVSGGDLALGANNLTMTGSLGSTGSRLTKGWFTDLQVTNSISGSITGNAATATALQTARAIGGVSFDGTADITVQTATGGFTVSGGDSFLSGNGLLLKIGTGANYFSVTRGLGPGSLNFDGTQVGDRGYLFQNSETFTVQDDADVRVRVRALTNNTLAGLQLLARDSGDYSWYIDNRGGKDSPNNRLGFFNNAGTEVFTLSSAGAIITGVWNGTQLGAAYVPALDGITAPAGNVSLNSHKITNLLDPTAAQDAATKFYVDAVATGLDVKASCRVATTANITLSGAQTIDGVSVIAGNRVLVKNQSTASDNGIYVCAAGSWSRATDADASAEVTGGMFVFISEGTVNASTGWALATADPITLGSTNLTFTQFSGAGTYLAGSGLTLTGSTFSIGAGQVTNAMLGGSIAASKLIGSDIATVGTIGTGTWQGTTVGVGYGGTGLASYAIGDLLQGSGATALSKLSAGAAGSFLRGAGAATLLAWSTLILPNAATANLIPYATGTNTWGESANLQFTGSKFGVNVTPTGVIHGKASADADIVGRFATTTNSTASGNAIQADMYDGVAGFSVGPDGSVTLGRAYDTANLKHAAQHVFMYSRPGSYSGKGLKLHNINSGEIVRLQVGAGGGLYVTDDTGNAASLLLGTRVNPGDATTFTASSGRWIINSGWFIVNNATARGFGQIESTSTSIAQFAAFYDSSNYFKTTVGSTGATTFALTGSSPTFTFSQAVNLTAKLATYNNIATTGWGVPAIYGTGRSTAQTAAVASVAAYTVGAADGSFEVSMNVLVTTSTLHSFNCELAYTDEGNTARVVTLQFSTIAGAFVTAITNAQGTVPYEGVPLHIRCKASTTITLRTQAAGTYTTVTYNAEGIIKQTG